MARNNELGLFFIVVILVIFLIGYQYYNIVNTHFSDGSEALRQRMREGASGKEEERDGGRDKLEGGPREGGWDRQREPRGGRVRQWYERRP